MAADARTHGWGEWIDFPGALPSLHRSDAKHPDPLTMLRSTPQASPRNCLRWEVAADSEGMSRNVAARMAGELREEPASLVCLATGASPQRAYELLAAEGLENPALVAHARWLKLDEWGGLAMDDPATCEVYLRRALLDPLQVPAERYMGWHSQTPDPKAECRRVAAWLREHGPIDCSSSASAKTATSVSTNRRSTCSPARTSRNSRPARCAIRCSITARARSATG